MYLQISKIFALIFEKTLYIKVTCSFLAGNTNLVWKNIYVCIYVCLCLFEYAFVDTVCITVCLIF